MDNIPVLSLMDRKERLQEFTFSTLEKHFKSKYDYLPNFYVRVPGRVNLIGEHIDYCGFSVLPMAIELDITMAVGVNKEKKLNLSNVDSGKYEDYSCCVDSINIDSLNPKWYHYFLCGFRGIVESCDLVSKGFDVAVKGTIPPASGLSSSSALVCAAALVTSYGNRTPLRKTTMASICADCERYIGTLGGGMDQAIAFTAQPGQAKLIDFCPLRTCNVKLPPGALFIIANSCVAMHKAETSHFNTRVIECKIATKVLAKFLGLDPATVFQLKDVGDQKSFASDAMAVHARKLLHAEPYTVDEVCKILNTSENEFRSCYLNSDTKDLSTFKIHQRAVHVYEEAARVIEFTHVCFNPPKDALSMLGKLMNESHNSCRDLYECSHPNLDELVKIALDAGALGSRLTGAGWGGCCVSLVPADKIVKFVEEVKDKYYMKTTERSSCWPLAVFTTKPGGGAVVFTA